MFQRAAFTLALLAALPAFAANELSVSRITGAATINHEGKTANASVKQGIKPGDVVAAAARSRAGLSLGNGGSFTLAGMSELQLFDSQADSAKAPTLAKLKLLAGAVRVVSSAGSGKLPQDIRLNVGTLKTRIYGAEVWGASTAEGDTVCLINGAVEIQTSSAESPERLSEPGACLRRDPEGKTARLAAADDAILPAAIAATVFPPELPAAPPAPPAPAMTAAVPPPAPMPPPAPAKPKPEKPAPVVRIIPTAPKPDQAVPPAPPAPKPMAPPKPMPPPAVAAAKPVPPPAPAVPPPPPPPAPAASAQGNVLIKTPVQTIVQSSGSAAAKPEPAKPAEVVKPTAKPAPVEKPKPAMTASEKPAAKPMSKGGKGWTVVVSSSTNKAAAEARTQSLQDQGFVANLRSAEVKGETVYRTTVGEFGSREEAQAYSERTLVKAGLKGWLSPL